MSAGRGAGCALAMAGVRPTAQRRAIWQAITAAAPAHVCADALHRDLREQGAAASLATVYNTLRSFEAAGLLRRVSTASGRVWFDTDTADHQHFYVPDEDRILDIPGPRVRLSDLPAAPAGYCIARVDVVIELAAEETPGAAPDGPTESGLPRKPAPRGRMTTRMGARPAQARRTAR